MKTATAAPSNDSRGIMLGHRMSAAWVKLASAPTRNPCCEIYALSLLKNALIPAFRCVPREGLALVVLRNCSGFALALLRCVSFDVRLEAFR